MAMVFCDVGADLVLGTFLRAVAVQDLKLKLFATDVTPNANGTDTTATYTEAAGGGYAEITLSRGTGWTITTVNDPSDAIYTQQTFTFTGALTTNAKIYGYYVTDNAGTTLLWAERLAVYFQPANNGDKLLITPKVQMSYGTPAA